ncbi:PAS domain-containing protein [Pontibacter sp. E15-1]|uniref:PAS domain-containing protein n=1 Tax=Pontibacter sp. E15-1 TaxID=2919918 RepID=UPI001F4FB60A|nr:PAS domain-containing protein [Pontibacter sp. E15-1]MCJ8165531.1 PAS domain-containing protein [Pontibacter sp. E15-1]
MGPITLPDNPTTVKPAIKKRLVLLSGLASALVILAGVLVLAGWTFRIEVLKRIWEEYVAMNPLTAICFILSGIGLGLLKKPWGPGLRLSRMFGAAVLLLSSLKFISLFIGWDYPLDHVLFADELQETSRGLQNRMAPNTAFCFVLSSLAILLIDKETSGKNRPAQFLSILVTLISLLSLYGYVYGVSYLIGYAAYIPMALHTALVFLILAVGLLFARPDKGIMLPIFCENTGEKLFARLFALVLPLLVGWIKLQGEYSGYYSQEFGTAVFALLTYIVSMVLLGRNAVERYRANQERYRADLILRENAHKLQSILDNTTTPIYIKDINGRFELVNMEFERVFEVRSEAIKGKTDAEVFPEKVGELIEEHDREVLELGETKTMEEVFLVEPEERTYITVKFPLKDTKGRINALCSIATDITERKKAEVLLRESEQKLNAILSSLGEAVVVADASGNFTYFNDIAEQILGLGITDTALPDWSARYGSFRPDGVTLYPSEELPLARGLRGESTTDVELFVRNDNIPEGRAIKVTGRPILDDQEKVIGSVVVCRDVTHEKQLEALIQESEQRLKTVIANIGEGVIVANRQGKFILFNKNAEEILGVGAAEVSIPDWTSAYGVYKLDGKTVFPPEELPLARALKGEITDSVEMLIKNERYPNGRYISVTGRPIKNEEGEITAGVVDFRDVTQIKLLEQTIKDLRDKYWQVIHRRKN